MKINAINRKYFSLGELFEYSTSSDDYLSSYNNGDVEYVSSSAENNGVSSMIDAIPSQKGNTLTIARNGSVGTTFYHKNSYCASSDDIRILTPKFNMNSYTGLFLSTIINKESFRFSYGRKLTKDKVLNMKIKLPTDEFGKPDRNFMEEYIKSLHHKPITTKNKPGKYQFNIKNWKEFKVGDLFNVINGKGLTIEEIEDNPGNIFCVQGGEGNNGSIGQIDIEYCKSKGYMIIDNNCLTVARVGTAGCVNFWSLPCVVGDKCKALLLKTHGTKYIYLFMQTILNQLQYKYSYGRGLVTEKYMSETIKLPIDSSGNPDREFMENYIKNLPYGDRI